MRILGIDPGATGALALHDKTKTPESGLRWIVQDMPVIGDPPELNATALRDFLRKHAPDHAFVEFANAMPVLTDRKTKVRRPMPATSSFRFGGMFFALKAVLACCDIPLTEVTPRTWKRSFALKGSNKEISRLRALQLFPDQSEILRRKKDHGRAEAMLIARYGSIVGYQLSLAAAE